MRADADPASPAAAGGAAPRIRTTTTRWRTGRSGPRRLAARPARRRQPDRGRRRQHRRAPRRQPLGHRVPVRSRTPASSTARSTSSVVAIKTWRNINAVRIPLNEIVLARDQRRQRDALGRATTRPAIKNYVTLLHKYDLIPILELHWVGPGTTLANRLQPMPDADHAPAFWARRGDDVPGRRRRRVRGLQRAFPDRNRDSDAGWQCWRDGCVANQSVPSGGAATTYQAAGMQAMVDAIRGTGSQHVILLGGVQYSNALSQWLTYKPTDPLEQPRRGLARLQLQRLRRRRRAGTSRPPASPRWCRWW